MPWEAFARPLASHGAVQRLQLSRTCSRRRGQASAQPRACRRRREPGRGIFRSHLALSKSVSYELTFMRIKKPTRKNQPPQTRRTSRLPAPDPLRIHTVSLADEHAGVLASLGQAASDQIGRRISKSAVFRSVLRLVAKGMLPEPAIWQAIEEEIAGGRLWGSKRTLPPRAPRHRAPRA